VNKQFYEVKQHKTMLQRLRKGVINRKKIVVKAFNKNTRRSTSTTTSSQKRQEGAAATAATAEAGLTHSISTA
jgi:hypothetical protein